MSLHQNLAPFEYIIGFAAVAAFISITDVTEVLKLIILSITVIGALIKLIEQYFKSESSLQKLYHQITELWKKMKKSPK